MSTEYNRKLYEKYTNGKIYENPLDDPYLQLINPELEYKLSDSCCEFIEKLSLEDMNNLTEDILDNNLKVWETGFDMLFRNKNTINVNEDKLIEILIIFKNRSQRLFEYTYHYILPYGNKVCLWVFNNLGEKSGLVIEDKENY